MRLVAIFHDERPGAQQFAIKPPPLLGETLDIDEFCTHKRPAGSRRPASTERRDDGAVHDFIWEQKAPFKSLRTADHGIKIPVSWLSRPRFSTPEGKTIADTANKADLKEQQRQSREEWRHLCETLERAQGDELGRRCKDKFQFVKTYGTYARDFDSLAADLKGAAAQGQYSFFSERGVPRSVLTPAFVELLLNDWKATILAKKRHLAHIFHFRFREDIETCIVTFEDSANLGSAESVHQSDALLQLSGMSQPTVTSQDLDELRAEISDLRGRLEELRSFVHTELNLLKRQSTQSENK